MAAKKKTRGHKPKKKSRRKTRSGQGAGVGARAGRAVARVVARGGQTVGQAVRQGLRRLFHRLAQGWTRLSPQHRRDAGGVLSLTIAILLALSWILPTPPRGLGWLQRIGTTLFGWGTLLVALALALAGLALLWSGRDDDHQPAPGQGWGLVLLTWAGLMALSALALRQGFGPQQGGGWLGGGAWWLLVRGFGLWGAWLWWTALVLLGWALLLNRPVIALLEPLVHSPRRWLRRLVHLRQRSGRRHRRRPKVRVVARPLPPAEAARPAGAQRGSVAPTQPAWVLPKLDEVLNPDGGDEVEEALDYERAALIEETLAHFGAPVQVVDIQRGPTVTLFGVVPDYVETRGGKVTRVRVNKIVSLADDLALALAAQRIRIQAPVPGKGYIGIEVPNEQPRLVPLRRVLTSSAFQRLRSPLALALGEDVAGHPVVADLRAMPHLLIAGATGSGKSVALNSIITTFLLFNTPDDLRLILIDPKRVELTGYNHIPHLLSPVVVEMDRVGATLQWVLQEMDRRYERLAQAGMRNIQEFHRQQGSVQAMPYLVVIIDELADLMMVAPTETERAITRLAQLARATGIHLVIATQRPSVDVVTGLIKANFPARMAFAVASVVDSRVILDRPGAERLLGRGDMLFLAPDAPEPVRVQGAFVSDAEIQRVVHHWRAQGGLSRGPATADASAGEQTEGPGSSAPLQPRPKVDPLLEQAIAVVRAEGRASISLLQRRLRIGYGRAARLIETLEERGIVSPPQGGTGVRAVLAPPENEADDASRSAPPAP